MQNPNDDGFKDRPENQPKKKKSNYRWYFIGAFIAVILLIIGGLMIGNKSANKMPGDQGGQPKDSQTKLGQNNASKAESQSSSDASHNQKVAQKTASSASSNSASSNAQTKTKTKSAGKVLPAVKVGQWTTDKTVSIKVNWVKPYSGDAKEKPDKGDEYLITNVTVKNLSKDDLDYEVSDFGLLVGSQKYDTDESLAHSKYGENQIMSGTLVAKKSASVNLIAQIPSNAKNIQLLYGPSVLHGDKLVADLD